MKQLDLKSIWLFFFSYVLRWFFVVIFFSIAFLTNFSKNTDSGTDFSFGFLNWLWFVIPLFLAISFVWARLTYHFYRYELTEIGFRKESGVIYKKYVTIPYDRIQNVDIYRGILARILGLSDLQIQTAGSSAVVSQGRMYGVGVEGHLPGLSKDIAEQLRDEFIQRAHKSKNLGL